MSVASAQTIIYTPAASSLTSFTILSQNLSGLGVSQNFVGTCPAGVPANSTLVYTVQAPRPAPLWYIASANATTSVSVATIENIPITLTPFASAVGFNQGFFQPNPGQKFNISVTNTAITVAAASLLFIQGVVENTLSQYLDLSTIAFENADRAINKPTFRQIVTGNTISAIPNTLVFDFDRYPTPHTENSLVTFKGLLNAQATFTYGSYNAVAGSSIAKPYVIVGGQLGSMLYPGGKGMTYTGSIFLLLNNIGLVSLPPTIPIPSMSTIYDETTFETGVGGDATENQISAQISALAERMDTYSGKSTDSSNDALGMAIVNVSRRLDDLVIKNTNAHATQERLLHMIVSVLDGQKGRD